MSKNNTPETGNKIDELNESLTGASRKIQDNKNMIMWVICIVIAAGLVVAAYFYFFKAPADEKAFNAYGSVEVANAAANDTVKAEAYKKVSDQYDGTDAGNLAALEAAEHYYDAGNYQDALKYVERFHTKDEVLRANVSILRGDCYVNLKKYDQAISEFEKAASESEGNSEIQPRALMKEATVYEAQNKAAKALEIYQRIQKDYPDFTMAGLPIDAYVERAKARTGK